MMVGCVSLPPQSRLDDQTLLSGEVVLTVYGLSCPLCASNLDQQLSRIPGVVELYPDLDTGAIRVTLADGHQVSVSTFARAIQDGGFTLQSARQVDE
jgi:copper chaperone CopZ